MKLAELLTEVNRIIYLDCDIVVNDSLSDLYNTDLEDNYVAGVIDIQRAMG